MKRQPGARWGVTLVELMIALVVSSTLLATVGVAIDASFKSYAANQTRIDLTQRARVALHRILNEIRSTTDHEPISQGKLAPFAAGAEVTDHGLILFRADGTEIAFFHNPQTRQLMAKTPAGTRPLLDGVSDFQVTMKPMWVMTEGNTRQRVAVLARASVQITVQSRTQLADANESEHPPTVTLASAVMPRANAW